MSLGNIILQILFPLRCISCGKQGEDFCIVCLSDCPTALRECAEWIFPVFDYRHPSIKKALWLLKYRNKKRIAKTFAHVMCERMLEELADLRVMENFTEPILVPIPLSHIRLTERGYNQAELLCREIIALHNFPLETNVLIKPRETEHQARLRDRSSRLKNLSGSFAVTDSELIKNKNVILVDDITTTGATLTEAKKILRKAGARKVIAFTVAH